VGAHRHHVLLPRGGTFEHSRFPYLAADRADAPRTLAADIVGHSCFADIIVLGAHLPEVEAAT